ncbi:hypothetical protein [Streptomyces lunaelactis]|uniref:hypothetical protein n=1 Tax=Streptomyces lunaelactis TaxID=1535768 RepID=UPI0015847D2C|nr:hypothetical protein [Streptomyces lunaelactis]NUK15691.1 hypothetical protein [Streptomyces lunaelactis]
MVIAGPHRHKGGAPMLGAHRAGEPGPFGIYTEAPGTDEPDLPRDVLSPRACVDSGDCAEDECAGLRDSEVMPPRTGRT